MIIKGHARGRAVQLAAHLLSAEQNESIRLHEIRGVIARNVKDALVEMEARGLASRSRRPLYHASISPDASTPLDDRQIGQAVDVLEAKLGLHGQPRVVVLHRKKNRDHIHVVWSRIDAETGIAISYSWNYRLHEQAARELEAAFGHRPIQGSQTARRESGTERAATGYEQRQAERGIQPSAVTAQVTALWQQSGSGAEFKRRLEEAGYILARGDRRVFVIVDQAGNVHSLARRIAGADAVAVRTRMRDVGLSALPAVSAGREIQRAKAVVGETRHKFTLASQETTGRKRRKVQTAAAPGFGENLGLAVALNTARTGKPPARRGRNGLSLILYRSSRAALFADFATRMAAARRNLIGDQLVAALAALEAERNAALDRLHGTQPWKKLRQNRPRPAKPARAVTPKQIKARLRARSTLGWNSN